MSTRRFYRSRNERGIYLIETLVALIIGTILCGMLLQILSESMRVTSTSANQQSADLVVQTVLDSFKASSPNSPQPKTSLLVCSTTALQQNPTPPTLPVCLNMGDLNWSPRITAGHFSGSAWLAIAGGPVPNPYTATATVTWYDSENLLGKTITTTTTISQTGINFWSPP